MSNSIRVHLGLGAAAVIIVGSLIILIAQGGKSSDISGSAPAINGDAATPVSVVSTHVPTPSAPLASIH